MKYSSLLREGYEFSSPKSHIKEQKSPALHYDTGRSDSSRVTGVIGTSETEYLSERAEATLYLGEI